MKLSENDKVIPEVYDFDMTERQEWVGDMKVEYRQETRIESAYLSAVRLYNIAEINLPNKTKAYKINVNKIDDYNIPYNRNPYKDTLCQGIFSTKFISKSST